MYTFMNRLESKSKTAMSIYYFILHRQDFLK